LNLVERERWLEDGEGSGSGDGEGSGDKEEDNSGSGSGSGSRDEEEEEEEDEIFYARALASTSSSSMAFVAVYASALSLALGLYGSTAIVGFTSLTGRYIGPCFSFIGFSMTKGSASSNRNANSAANDDNDDSSTVADDDTELGDVGRSVTSISTCKNAVDVARKVICTSSPTSTSSRSVDIASMSGNLHVGLFMGALLLFSNLLLICAVIFGELRVEDYLDDRDRDEQTPYAIEQIATVFSVLCMFLAVLYLIFAVLMFVYYEAMLEEDAAEEEVNGMTTNLTTNHRHSNSVTSMLHSRSRSHRRRSTRGKKNEPLMYTEGALGTIIDVGANTPAQSVLNTSKHSYLAPGVYS